MVDGKGAPTNATEAGACQAAGLETTSLLGIERGHSGIPPALTSTPDRFTAGCFVIRSREPRVVAGRVWRSWGVYKREFSSYDLAVGRWRVTHIPTGYGVGDFLTSTLAQRFCRAIDDLTDWPTLTLENQYQRFRSKCEDDQQLRFAILKIRDRYDQVRR